MKRERWRLERSISAAEWRVATWRAALNNAPRRERAAHARELDEHLNTQAALGELHAALIAPNSPEAWLDRHGATSAQLAQVTVALEYRRRRKLDRVAQLAITRPPAFIIEALGDRPTRQAEARRWERTDGALARWQAEHAFDPERDGALGPRPAGRNDAARWERLALEIADPPAANYPDTNAESDASSDRQDPRCHRRPRRLVQKRPLPKCGARPHTAVRVCGFVCGAGGNP